MDPRDFVELLRDGPEGSVIRERHVPDLSREDHHDAGQLEADVALREEGDHPEDEPRKEAEDGDSLSDVEKRDQHLLGSLRVRGRRPDDEGEEEREEIGGETPREGEERVAGEGGRGEVDLDRRPHRRFPAPREADDGRDARTDNHEEEKIHAGALHATGAENAPAGRQARVLLAVSSG